MKRYIFLTILAGATLQAAAQEPIIRSFFEQYQDQPGASFLKLRGWSIHMAAEHLQDPADRALLEKIDQLQSLLIQQENTVNKQAGQKLMQRLRNLQYQNLLHQQDEQHTLDVLIREKDGNITGLLLLRQTPNEFILLHLQGQLRFEDLNDLNLDIKGLDVLQQLPDNREEWSRA